MVMKLTRIAFTTVVTQLLALGIAAAQPTPPPPPSGDEDDPAPGKLPGAGDGTTTPPNGDEETEAEAIPDEATAAAEKAAADKAAAAAADKAKDGRAGYDKGFYIKSHDDQFSLKINGRVQPYYTLTRYKTSTGGSDYKGAFEIRRARLILEGELHGKDLLYKMQTDFGKGRVQLKDFIFDVHLRGETWLRVGQWKRPFNRQSIASSGKLELTDRAITDEVFDPGQRDIGLAVRNDYEKSPDIEWVVGIFNGTGIDNTTPVVVDPMTGAVISVGQPTNIPTKFRPAIIGRIGLNDGGIKGYSEADLEGGGLRWGAAASVWLENDFDEDNKSNDKVELDYVVKDQGFSSTGAVYASTTQTDHHPYTGQELQFIGFLVQAGYMITPKYQAVARYALISDRLDGGAKNRKELSVGGGYYAYGHDAKLQAALRFIQDGAAGFGDSVLFEVETQVGFQ